MADDTGTTGTWIETCAEDTVAGDLIRTTPDAEPRRIKERDYPGVYMALLRFRYEGEEEPAIVNKHARIEIFDPDGDVAARIRLLSFRHRVVDGIDEP